MSERKGRTSPTDEPVECHDEQEEYANEPGRATNDPQNGDRRRSGKRKAIKRVAAGPLRWPDDIKEQRELFDLWHLVAMRRCHRHELSFQLVAVIRRVINWKSGKFWVTNDTLARLAGGCHPKTIERGIAGLVGLGLLEWVMGYVDRKGRKVRRRIVNLTFPADVDDDDMRAAYGPE